MQNWSNMIKNFQDGLSGMPEEDKMRLPGEVIAYILLIGRSSGHNPALFLRPENLGSFLDHF